MALGDSTGVGIGARNGGYVERLFTRIKRLQPQASLVNACDRGATTQDIWQKQLTLLTSARPTLITLEVGANDLINGVKDEQFAGNYEKIVARLTQETPATILLMNIPDLSLAPAVPVYMRQAARQRINAFNQSVENVARQHNLKVVDLFAKKKSKVEGQKSQVFWP